MLTRVNFPTFAIADLHYGGLIQSFGYGLCAVSEETYPFCISVRKFHTLLWILTKFSLLTALTIRGGSVAKWLVRWTQAQKVRVHIAAATLSFNSLGQTVHTHCTSVHQEQN